MSPSFSPSSASTNPSDLPSSSISATSNSGTTTSGAGTPSIPINKPATGKPPLHIIDRMQSPRPGTPEPDSRQGRRNVPGAVQLLDDEGSISDQLEKCLQHIFAKYCEPRVDTSAVASPLSPTSGGATLLVPPEGAYLSNEGLDTWATDTNGAPFAQETKDELIEFLDVTDDGGLTFKGFMQIYQLQTENDEEETWRDLSSHGFDRSLRLVSTRREDESEVYKS